MKALPLIQTDDRVLNQMQRNVAGVLQPLIANPIVDGRLVQNVQLAVGTTQVAHGLGRPLTGWWLTRLRSGANVYDAQALNGTPEVSLALVSDAAVTVDIYVF